MHRQSVSLGIATGDGQTNLRRASAQEFQAHFEVADSVSIEVAMGVATKAEVMWVDESAADAPAGS
jgi:hypothetical protein